MPSGTASTQLITKNLEASLFPLPIGYRYAAAHAGIRKDKRHDLALIVSDTTASAAGVFTKNLVQAAPVLLSKANLKASRGKASVIVVNAGNANCATRTGAKVALDTCKAVAKALRIPVEHVLPASTGVIGVEMDGSKLTTAMPSLVASLGGDFESVAKAILTTDLVPKRAAARLATKGGTVTLSGMTKGSGMIHPMMATTLGFVMTDARLSPTDLKPMLQRATARSFNRLSVDGDMSTNDTIFLLANGASGSALTVKEKLLFEEALTHLLEDLAIQIARDGEGATKLVTIDVAGTRNEADAETIARAIANSPLVKTAIYGNDANWGRILAAAGYAGVKFDPAHVEIDLQGVTVCRGGLAAKFNEEELKYLLNTPDVRIDLRIQGKGKGRARFFTCDFTEGYIKINASYRS